MANANAAQSRGHTNALFEQLLPSNALPAAVWTRIVLMVITGSMLLTPAATLLPTVWKVSKR